MRYVDLLTDPVVAGPHRRVQNLAAYLAGQGHHPLILSPPGIPETFVRELTEAGVEHATVPGLAQLRKPSLGSLAHNIGWLLGGARVFLSSLLDRQGGDPEFYVLNGAVNVALARHADLRNIPGILVVNDTLLPGPLFSALTALLPVKTKIVYQTPSVKRHYLGGGDYSFTDDDIMPPGVDLSVFTPDPGREFVVPRSGKTVHLGSLCNVSPRKGIEDAIDVTERLGWRMPELKFTYTVTGEKLATQSAYCELLAERASTCPSNCEIRFRDPVDQAGAAQFLRTIDWLLVPSRSESFPQSVVQAQAVGTPVLAYDIAGLNDQIVDSETGFLVPANDVAEMSRKLIESMKDPVLLQEVTAAARARVTSEFTMERNARDFLALVARGGSVAPKPVAIAAKAP